MSKDAGAESVASGANRARDGAEARGRAGAVEYGHEPAVTIVADCEGAVEKAASTLRRAGCRVAAVAYVGEAMARLDAEIAPRDIFIELGDGPGEHFPALVDRIGIEIDEGRRRALLAAPFGAIDTLAANDRAFGLHRLCEASEEERVEAVRTMTLRRPPNLEDVGRDGGEDRLSQFGEEVRRLASALVSLSEEAASAGVDADAAEEGGRGSPIAAGQVRAVIRARRMRDQFFSRQLFADPAWDMLLDLTAARLEHQRVAVSSLCIAAMVPPTTALRWIKTLTDNGLFERRADPQDGRRVYIQLSDGAAGAMQAWFRAVSKIPALPV